MDDDPFQIPNYPDMIVIPFRIPWASASAARARRPARPLRDRLPAMGWAGASPSDRPDDFEPLGQASASAPPPEARLIVAGVQGQPTMAVSGSSDGALTLWRRGGEQGPPQALANFTADLDGSLRAADGKFLGWLLHADTAVLDPEWLRKISGIPAPLRTSFGEARAFRVMKAARHRRPKMPTNCKDQRAALPLYPSSGHRISIMRAGYSGWIRTWPEISFTH